MLKLIEMEFLKMKRYHILLIGIIGMTCAPLLQLFSQMVVAEEYKNPHFDMAALIANTIWGNATIFMPVLLTLVGGYLIDREYKDDTLKNILTVPVSYCGLLWGKLFVCALLSLFLGAVSALFTVIANILMGFPGVSAASILQTFIQIILSCLFLYIAVMPVIAMTARIANGHMVGTIVAFVYGYGGMFAAGNATLADIYPVTASLGLISYRSYDPTVHWNVLICCFSMLAAFLLSAVFVFTTKGGAPAQAAKKQKKVITKKGW